MISSTLIRKKIREGKIKEANKLLNRNWSVDGKVIKGTDKELGGTMRLGSYEAKLKENSMIKKIYGKNR